jgi:hypothetical protein
MILGISVLRESTSVPKGSFTPWAFDAAVEVILEPRLFSPSLGCARHEGVTRKRSEVEDRWEMTSSCKIKQQRGSQPPSIASESAAGLGVYYQEWHFLICKHEKRLM